MKIYLSRYIVSFIVTLCLFSCNSTETTSREYTYFGGEIINPNSNYIVLYKSDVFCDTIYLNKKNQFLHKMENLSSGLYYFTHTPERQLVNIEKGDSILLRLNTLEFDESLVYTGDGARKNNFLIDMFLENEKEMIELNRINFNQPLKLFKRNQDSLLKRRLNTYNKFIDRYRLSDLAKHIAKSIFIYDFYTRNEMYFYKNYGTSDFSNNNLPISFFDYRKEVNFNDKEIMSMFSYNWFLRLYFTNSTLIDLAEKQHFNLDSDDYIVHKLDLVDCLIEESFLKNYLLMGIAENFLIKSDNNLKSSRVLEHYLLLSSNEKHQKELIKLIKFDEQKRASIVKIDTNLITINE